MNKFYCLLLLLSIGNLSAKEGLNPPFIDSLYKEDQFYLRLNYLQLNDVGNANGIFPFSVAGGFILDMPFNKDRNVGMGLGLGYRFSNYGLEPIIESADYVTSGTINENIIRTNSVELPIEFRWRTSTPETFYFWRIYTGLLLEYTWSNKVIFKTEDNESHIFKNFDGIEPFKAAFTISAGHSTWNINAMIGLNNLIKKSYTTSNNQKNTVPFNVGFTIYFL